MNKVKGYRVMLGYSQEEMAKILGLNRDSYRMKESGERQFNLEEMIKFLNEVKKMDDTVSLDAIFLN